MARIATFLTLLVLARGELMDEVMDNRPKEMSAKVKGEEMMEMDNVPDSTAIVEEIKDIRVENETSTMKPESPTDRRNVTFVNQTKPVFMPSFHLGPIAPFTSNPPLYDVYRQASSSSGSGSTDRTNSPYNGQRAIKFEGKQSNRNQNEKHSNSPFRPSDRDENYVKFVDDKSEDHRHENGGEKCNKETNRQGEPSSVEPIIHQPDYGEQQQVVGYAGGNYGGGQQQYVTTYQTKPLKTHEATGYTVPYQQAMITNDNNQYTQYHAGQYDGYHDENAVKPETIINVHPVSYQTTNVDALSKPNTVVYVTTHETIRTRKIPFHQFYQPHQPQVYEHTNPPLELPENEDPYQYPVFYDHHNHHKSISPWKKILHLIGAFLPIGLLIALLSPKVISATTNASGGTGATGDPNIVLSKLRVNDLSAEHKHTRLALDTGPCEERSICRLLVAAGEDGAELLKEMLVYAAERTLESAVRKKELDRIFEAAKLGNCDILTCGFYDGT